MTAQSHAPSEAPRHPLARRVGIALSLIAFATGLILYLRQPSQGDPLPGTEASLAKPCTYDYTQNGVVAPVHLLSVNDGPVIYQVTVTVTSETHGDLSQAVKVETPDGRKRQSVNVFVPMDRSLWESDGYRHCSAALDW